MRNIKAEVSKAQRYKIIILNYSFNFRNWFLKRN